MINEQRYQKPGLSIQELILTIKVWIVLKSLLENIGDL